MTTTSRPKEVDDAIKVMENGIIKWFMFCQYYKVQCPSKERKSTLEYRQLFNSYMSMWMVMQVSKTNKNRILDTLLKFAKGSLSKISERERKVLARYYHMVEPVTKSCLKTAYKLSDKAFIGEKMNLYWAMWEYYYTLNNEEEVLVEDKFMRPTL